jgi:hypothetical protein
MIILSGGIKGGSGIPRGMPRRLAIGRFRTANREP